MQECLQRLSINCAFAKYSLDNRVRVVNSNEVRIVKVSAPPQKNGGECSRVEVEVRMATQPPQIRPNSPTYLLTHARTFLHNPMIYRNFWEINENTNCLVYTLTMTHS